VAGKKKGKSTKKSGKKMRDLDVRGVRGGASNVKGGARNKVKM
jgi:hypothetical protein